MQTITQIVKQMVPPARLTVEWKVIFEAKDYDLATQLCQKYGDPINEPLSEDTPLADILQNLQMLMFRLEQYKAAKK